MQKKKKKVLYISVPYRLGFITGLPAVIPLVDKGSTTCLFLFSRTNVNIDPCQVKQLIP